MEIESGIFAKLFLDESDSDEVVEFFDFARVNHLKQIAPNLFLYEVLAVADKRHVAKTKNFGSVVLLENWKSAFSDMP